MKYNTRKEAIDAKCKDCIYDSANGGTWLQQVEACTCVKSCPLYEFRPVTTKTRKLRQEAKIAGFSPEELKKYQEKQEKSRITLVERRAEDCSKLSYKK